VHVGVGHRDDVDLLERGHPLDLTGAARGIDHDADPAVVDQVAPVPQCRDVDGHDLHRYLL